MNQLNVKIFDDPSKAPTFRPPEFKGIDIKQMNIIRKGTTEGRSTVDIIVEDENGQKYAGMITARLITMLATMINEPNE